MTDVLQPKMAGGGIISHQPVHTFTGRKLKSSASVDAKGASKEPLAERPSSDSHQPFLGRQRPNDGSADGEGHGVGDGTAVDGCGDEVDGYDMVDALPENLRYNWFDLLCTLISIVTYMVDLVMDCVVAYYFYHLAVNHGIYHYWYFGLTTFFVVLPSLTMTGFSFRWYLMDSDHSEEKVSMTRWVLRLFILFFQIAPILRYIDSIRYGVLSRVAKFREERATSPDLQVYHRRERVKYYTLMVYEDADATLLRLFESFMESAPQLVLQIYILIKDPHANRINNAHIIDEGVDPYLKLTILALSVTSSLVSLAWSLVVYHRSLRYTFHHKKNISLVGTLFQFLWQFASITGRVLALALFASVFPKWIGPLCAAHWLVMSSWVIYQRTSACNTHCEEFLFAQVLGAIYIFSFFNAKEEKTRNKYLLYFTFSFVENSSLLAIWFWKVNKSVWYVYPALFGHYLAFFGGIMFMLCYYIWFHPTGIEMPFFKFLQAGRTPKKLGRKSTQMVKLEDATITSPRLTTRENMDDIRATASSPDLVQELDILDDDCGKDRLKRSYSVPPPRSAQGHQVPRKLKKMGLKSQESTT